MTDIAELVTDLDDGDVEILTRLVWRIGQPHDEAGAWPPRVERFFHHLSAGLAEEVARRRGQVQALRDALDDGGVGALADEVDEDLSGWSPDTPDAA